ncbi:MAG: peroxiredoxin [Nitrosomonas sp.]|jgi:peroxiredoxin Q/BCP|nr:peroxiredoxin [Nitrosomonas sp.]MBP6354728.1 peroxiredoxin [Nitrosomonas sp.]MBP9839176.1 peroxiredoxin [Pseudomonadota bacterium]
MVQLEHSVENFILPSTSGKDFSLAENRDKYVIIYFYPKDDTPGCTSEGQDFRDHWDAFKERNCVVVGISRDSLDSHESFKKKIELPFELLSDVDGIVCKLFDVIKMKNVYGKQVLGIERSTFVIDTHGILRMEWRGVKVPGHVSEVLNFVVQDT